MTLTLTNLRSRVDAAIGGVPPVIDTDADTSRDRIVNEAGRFFYAMHSWSFAGRPPVSLTLTQDQAYVPLPDDFQSLHSLRDVNNYASEITMTTSSAISQLRNDAVTAADWVRAGTIVYPAPAAVGGAPLPPRIEIYPTPSATRADALELWYRAGWVDLTDPSHIANVPGWIEPLLVQVAWAFSQGYANDQLDNRVSSLMDSMMFREMKQNDGMVQPSPGPRLHSHTSGLRHTSHYLTSPVQAPS